MIDNETERRLNAFLRDKGVNPEGNDEVIHPDPVSALCAAYEELEHALGVSRSSNRQRQERNEELWKSNVELRRDNLKLAEENRGLSRSVFSLEEAFGRIERASRDAHLCQYNDDISRGLEIALEIAKGKR